ncbi:hypothetical protein [Kribbella soli]|uniref:Uncharacterized protein n=1 Tax=Kribbella soli TaxID=1124743 RepID=A0A4R0HD82_9ACTN|nr:hypothetical protein [Kribbella soli]TCC08531.1 hypothetical protein E0H45_21925 [Kribbella soli]
MGKLGWAMVALSIGLTTGWWAGAFTTACGPADCHANWDAIEAIGTWVGGIGTVAAVLFAVRAFRSEEAARRDEQATRVVQMQREQDAEFEKRLAAARDLDRIHTEANMVFGVVTAYVGNRVEIQCIRVSIRNGANETETFKMSGELPGYGQTRLVHSLAGGQSEQLAAFGQPLGTPTDQLPKAVPEADRARFYEELTAALTITFDMNGRSWRRVGRREAELLS